MRVFTIVFLGILNGIAQEIPAEYEYEFSPNKIDSIDKSIFFEETFESLPQEIEFVKYNQSEYSEGNLFSTYEYFKNQEYKITSSTYYYQDSKRIYSDGSCNCDQTIDTIYFKKEKVKIKIDTLLMSKGRYQVTKTNQNNINTEKFLYNAKNQLDTYYFGYSYSKFKHKKRSVEYKHYRADTVEAGYEQYEKEGYVGVDYVEIGVDPVLYKHVIRDKLDQIIRIYTIDNFFEEELTATILNFDYNKKGLPVKRHRVVYEFNRYSLDKNAQAKLGVLFKDIKKIEKLKEFSNNKTIYETKYFYDKGKLTKVFYSQGSYDNKNGVFEKKILEDDENVGKEHLEILYTNNKRIINYYVDSELSGVDEYLYDTHDNLIAAQKYLVQDNKKELLIDTKQEIKYKK
ncbi:hypothetical protein [Aquimarina sp. 2201CG5-10]|uniref:hypothetical protein n=1 Tax=Aquimarina callyspongiae TaxID=3098150 RepID=UPI002AB51ACC|nr:hypothetical protein [Aquimarina sp. 2201CG5-10]MDY8134739.1 hypothetical protein [Aquimarina sp. 2201CG5-10]